MHLVLTILGDTSESNKCVFWQVITDFKAPDGMNKETIDAAGDGK